jgi:hypothetical protein
MLRGVAAGPPSFAARACSLAPSSLSPPLLLSLPLQHAGPAGLRERGDPPPQAAPGPQHGLAGHPCRVAGWYWRLRSQPCRNSPGLAGICLVSCRLLRAVNQTAFLNLVGQVLRAVSCALLPRDVKHSRHPVPRVTTTTTHHSWLWRRMRRSRHSNATTS